MSRLLCIGLDMATRKSGWAVVSYDSVTRELTVHKTGLATSKAKGLVQRGFDIYWQLAEGPIGMIGITERAFGAIEAGFVYKNKKTAMDLAFMRGVGSIALANACLIDDILLLAPMEIRASLGFAKGVASKAEVARRVNTLASTNLQPGDEADAAAAAIAALIGRSAFRKGA